MYESTLPAYDPRTWEVETRELEPLVVNVSGLNREIDEDETFEDEVILQATY
jgi:hypothetical protein